MLKGKFHFVLGKHLVDGFVWIDWVNWLWEEISVRMLKWKSHFVWGKHLVEVCLNRLSQLVILSVVWIDTLSNLAFCVRACVRACMCVIRASLWVCAPLSVQTIVFIYRLPWSPLMPFWGISLVDALSLSLFYWQELNSRAQGEVSIREALRELELWGAGAVFSLTSYTESSGKELSIIKDWKDLVNQVNIRSQKFLFLVVLNPRCVSTFACYLLFSWCMACFSVNNLGLLAGSIEKVNLLSKSV